MSDCLFCKIIDGEIPATKIYEDAQSVAFMDINPASKGHLLVIPKRHAADIYEIHDDDLKHCSTVAKNMAQRVRDRLGASGVNLLNSTGADAWQTVFHFHIHVIPRYFGDPLRLPWVPTPGDFQEISEVAQLLVE